jgi:hypothetical protein
MVRLRKGITEGLESGPIICLKRRRQEYTRRISVENREANTPLERPRRRSEDNIKIHPRELGWDGMDYDRLCGLVVRVSAC